MTDAPHQTGQGPGQADVPADWAPPPTQAEVITPPPPDGE